MPLLDLAIEVKGEPDGSRTITISNHVIRVTVALAVPDASEDYAEQATAVICGLPEILNWVFDEDARRRAEMN